MKVSESDPRSMRTRETLRAALMRLAAEKQFTHMTIQDVTTAAGINRTTFYLHYAGLHELMEDCARTLFTEMRAEIYANRMVSPRPDGANLAPFVESVFRHLERHETFYCAVLGRQGDPLFRGLFQELLAELIFEPVAGQFRGKPADPRLELNLRFFSAGFAGVAAWWLEKGKPVTVEQAALQVARELLPDYLRLMGGG